MAKRIAFIGTGIMGAPIAQHLLNAGHELHIFTRTKAKAESLIQAGAIWHESAADAAAAAEVTFTMLGYPEEIEELYLGQEKLLEAAPKHSWLIDLSTSSPLLAKELHDAAEIMDKHVFDCPVTGGEAGAIAGTLTLIAGISEKEAGPVKDLLECFGSKIFYMGEAGKGQVAKLCNQVALAGAMVGYADALALAESANIDQAEVLELINAGMGMSRASSELAPLGLEKDYKPRFKVAHLKKDLNLALQTADDNEIAMPGAETSYNLFDILDQVGGSNMGTQAINLLYAEEKDGVAAGLDWSKFKDAHEHADEHDCGCDGDCDCGHEHHHHH